jgi:hypothetical protein
MADESKKQDQEPESKPEIRVWNMPLNPDESELVQMERFCEVSGDDRDLAWLVKEVYQNPQRMSLFTDFQVVSPKSHAARPEGEFVNPSLKVSRREAIRAFASMARIKGVPENTEGVMTYDGRNIVIRLAGFETAVEATGFWPGQARLPASLLTRLGKAPLPDGDPVVFEVSGNRLRIGTLHVQCTWDTGADSRIELPLNPPLISVLRVAHLHSPEEIERSGLSELVSKAEQMSTSLVSEATSTLSALGVTTAQIESVVKKSVAQTDRPLSLEETQTIVG